MSTQHSKAAKEFLKNQTYAKWHDGTKIERKNGTAKQIDRRFRRLLRFFCWGSKKKRLHREGDAGRGMSCNSDKMLL